ncbi:MAG: hypothetical protein KR126chlam6_00295 [Candidatus Anoxychlamydiales bacterium]|nr:hypothetical protein [Candidatus Anoxychlamydiales bacterium]
MAAVEPSVPDYKRSLINNLEELKKEFKWCLDNPKRVSTAKIEDFKRGVRTLRIFTQEKIKDEKFIRDIERFDVLISNLSENITDIEKAQIEMVFERIQKLIHDLG